MTTLPADTSSPTTQARSALTEDAGNRAIRALLVALVVAVFVDVWPVVSNALDGDGAIETAKLAQACLRVGLQAAGSFVLRRVLDPSRVPTPLPPRPQPEPATADALP